MTGALNNIAFAGLTAAGKTTHARRLAAELGYDYVSATDILLDLLGIDGSNESIWRTRLDEVNAARHDGRVDAELEERLIELNRERERTVFDTWALAWIGDGPLIRIWIESDLESRIRKCTVSQGDEPMSPWECRSLLQQKDDFNRRLFRLRHKFDLFTDRRRYNAVLTNSHLIPDSTASAARFGIETFAPIVKEVTACVAASDRAAADALRDKYPKEVQRVVVLNDAEPR